MNDKHIVTKADHGGIHIGKSPKQTEREARHARLADHVANPKTKPTTADMYELMRDLAAEMIDR